MENIWFVAAAWMALALIASVVSIRLGISVALVEMFVGVIGGNSLGFYTTPWIDFLATFGSGLLTFLAGAEIDPESLRKHLKPSLVIGAVSFFLPFLGAMAFAHYIVGWELHAAQIAGIALSTTSVAVVYAVMVETGLSNTDFGKLILAACFVTDLGTVLVTVVVGSAVVPTCIAQTWFLPKGVPTAAPVSLETTGPRTPERERLAGAPTSAPVVGSEWSTVSSRGGHAS
jgi:Kef-type K+ transport system membrane component KefB